MPIKSRAFKSGNSRAVRIPKEIDLALGDVYVEKRGDEIVIREKPLTIGEVLDREGFKGIPDFMKGWKRDRRDEPHRRKVIDDFARGH